MKYSAIALVTSLLAAIVTATPTFSETEVELLEDAIRELKTKQSPKESEFLKSLVDKAVNEGLEVFNKRQENDRKLFKEGVDKVPSADTVKGRLALFNSITNPRSQRKSLEKLAEIGTFATVQVSKSLGQKTPNVQALMKNKALVQAFQLHPVLASCFTPILLCPSSAKYRTADGRCNNLVHQLWGKSETPQIRFIPPNYNDEVGSPRTKDINGNNLPSARTVSVKVLRTPAPDPSDSPDDLTKTVMVTAWGQFLDHDITETPAGLGYNGASPTCCGSPLFLSRSPCFPITVEPSDPYFPSTTTCLDFVRSSPAPSSSCFPGFREQLNAITSFVDASNVYGSETHKADELRSFSHGRLDMAGDNLPPDADSTCTRDTGSPTFHHCQKAGDVRVNEIVHLGTLHLAFVREHNRIAGKLRVINPCWNDETLYQETRKIIGAFMQRISYDEWMPQVLGNETMTSEDLYLSTPYTYDPTVNPSIRNSFAAAAMRYGHTLIDSHVSFLNSDFFTATENNVEDHFFHPLMIFQNVGKIARWTASSSCKKSDKLFVKGVQDELFKDAMGHSTDLAALNIQRGRDHGLPSYVAWRQFCGLSVPATFADLTDHSSDTITAFQSTYANVQDIDLFAGAISENLVSDGNVGPTFACLMGKQFHALKFGDRFWYQNTASAATRFTPSQIVALNQIKLSKILCENFNLDYIQPNVFNKQDGGANPWQMCSSLPDLNVNPWLDNTC